MNRISKIKFIAAALLACGLFAATASAEKNQTISEIMKKAYKGETSLVKKVTSGQATEEEIKELLAYNKTIAGEKPSRGESASWQEKTTTLIHANESLLKKEADALQKLKQATNCKACHNNHKPE